MCTRGNDVIILCVPYWDNGVNDSYSRYQFRCTVMVPHLWFPFILYSRVSFSTSDITREIFWINSDPSCFRTQWIETSFPFYVFGSGFYSFPIYFVKQVPEVEPLRKFSYFFNHFINIKHFENFYLSKNGRWSNEKDFVFRL